jgi:transposase
MWNLRVMGFELRQAWKKLESGMVYCLWSCQLGAEAGLFRSQGPKASQRSRKLPGLRLLAFWLAKPAVERQPGEQQWVQAIMKEQPQIATAENLAQTFRQMVKSGKAGELDAWLKSAETSGINELKGFAVGIRRDHAAVVAGIEKPWSNGQVEGQVHRLKLLKRQMYGRSGFILLRRRALPFIAHHLKPPLRSP